TQGLQDAVKARYFLAARQSLALLNSPTFLIRTSGESSLAISAVRKTIQHVDARLPIMFTSSIEQEIAPLIAQGRVTARLGIVFACVALTLAAIGLYGVLSCAVARRTGEIAIRLALGARSGRVISMILRETASVIIVGLVLGAGLAYPAARVIEIR